MTSTEPRTTAAAFEPSAGQPTLARRLGAFDATMIVMGGIIGAGIFVNPSVVARQVHTPGMVLGAWMIGGAIALMGAFVYAELAALRPRVGGQYAYLRDAYHPIVAFLYGWTLLLVVQTGGMAGAAIIFGRYLRELSGVGISEQAAAALTLGVLTLVNCLGVRAGSNVQSALMITKLAAILGLIGVGLFGSTSAPAAGQPVPTGTGSGGLTGLATAMVPVLFAYGGWQTSSFVSGEMKNPRRDLPRGLLIGVIGVIVLYLSVTYICLRSLGVDGLAATSTPASEVMRRALGDHGARLIALGIAISTVGFLSQSVLTALTGKYDQILNYVEAIDVLFFGLTGASLIIFRMRARKAGDDVERMRVPLHPLTTGLFVLACWLISLTTVVRYPAHAGVGFGILLVGVAVYFLWARRQALPPAEIGSDPI